MVHIVDMKRFQQKDDVAQVDSLDFRNCIISQLFHVRAPRVQPEAFAPCYSAGSSSALVGRYFGDANYYQRFHTGTGAVRVLPAESWIYDVDDVVNL